MTRYRIVVTEIGQELTQIGGQWREGAGEEGGFGFTPNHEDIRDYERQVYAQEMSELDLPKLVRTVNPEATS